MTLRTPNLNVLLFVLSGCYIAATLVFGVASLIPPASVDLPREHPRVLEKAAARASVEIAPLRNRPLFHASRRPPQSAAPQALEQDAELRDLRVALIAMEGRLQSVTLESTLGENLRVKVGQKVRGWRVESIDKFGVTFTRGQTKVRLDTRTPAAAPNETRVGAR